MPRYYFNVVAVERLADSIGTVLDDTDGTVLADSASAFAHGVQVIRELMFKRTGMLGQPWSAWTMHVNDKDGKAVHRIQFRDLPESERKQ
jgi:hypothetical protein